MQLMKEIDRFLRSLDVARSPAHSECWLSKFHLEGIVYMIRFILQSCTALVRQEVSSSTSSLALCVFFDVVFGIAGFIPVLANIAD